MRMRASRILGLALAVAVVGLFATTPGQANCLGGGSLFQGFAGHSFVNCGDQVAWGFAWQHHRAVQRLVSGTTTSGPAGVDSGALSTVVDTMIAPFGAEPGAYTATYDWGFAGPDGCITTVLEPDTSCSTGLTNTLPVMDFTIGGRNAAAPRIGLAAVISVDGNEVFQAWVADQAGVDCSTNVTPGPCGLDGCEDATNNSDLDIVCGSLPTPGIVGPTTCDAGGCNLTVSVAAHNVPVLDDCAVAASKAINCPRNLYVGRALMVKRASCTAPPADNRTFIMTSDLAGATFPGTVVANFVPYSPQDTNLNGVIDGTEVGPAVPVVLTGNSLATTPVRITKIVGATDCAYLAVALKVDGTLVAPGESVYTPVASVNGIPISLDQATPVSDRVYNMLATKSSGKASVAWDTTAEFSTAGFNLIGEKKNGGTVQLNSSLIQAKKGTTGEGASYDVSLGGGDLKGATAVYVELVKTNGAKERFGPVRF